jgi:hypothetical protein
MDVLMYFAEVGISPSLLFGDFASLRNPNGL